MTLDTAVLELRTDAVLYFLKRRGVIARSQRARRMLTSGASMEAVAEQLLREARHPSRLVKFFRRVIGIFARR